MSNGRQLESYNTARAALMTAMAEETRTMNFIGEAKDRGCTREQQQGRATHFNTVFLFIIIISQI